MQIYVTLCQARAHSGLRLGAQKKFPGYGFCFLADAAAAVVLVVAQMYAKLCLKCGNHITRLANSVYVCVCVWLVGNLMGATRRRGVYAYLIVAIFAKCLKLSAHEPAKRQTKMFERLQIRSKAALKPH